MLNYEQLMDMFINLIAIPLYKVINIWEHKNMCNTLCLWSFIPINY